MLDRIARFITRHAMFPKGSAALMGVSGGADSVALLHALCLLKDGLGISVEAAHFNHDIRRESDSEELFVRELCKSLGVPLHTGRADVPKLAKERGISLEVAAREARHGFFRQVMAGRGIERLALAHHRDDQAETLLLRLIRGSGADGLAAMAPAGESGIVRPLLCVGREEIRGWCLENGFSWVEDASNADTSIPRNWVRHELMPMIRERLNPRVNEALCRAAELLREDASCLNELARAALNDIILLPGGGVSIPVRALAVLPPAIQSRALRQMMNRAGLTCDVERVNVDDVAELLGKGRTGRRISLDGGAVAYREADALVVAPKLPETEKWEPVKLAVPGETAACGGVFTAELLDAVPPDMMNHPQNFQYFDFVSFPADVCARGRRDGDRFHPLGAPGGRKLKEYLIDRKVSRWARNAIPLLASGAEVLWAVGLGIADGVKVTEKTAGVLKITYMEKEKPI